MIKLLILFIVAGLVFESKQQSMFGEFASGDSDLFSEADHDNDEEDDQEINSPLSSIDNFALPPTLVGTCYYPVDTKCWTEWFDRDNPCGSGDWEDLSSIMTAYPGKMCSDPADMEVETVSGVPVSETGDTIDRMDTTQGFVCLNDDQDSGNCQDYRVRFSCYAPFCSTAVCLTDWFDRDNPSGTGDWELLSDLKENNPGKICDKPLFIEVVTVDTLAAASTTGDSFHVFNPTEGFVCRMTDQSDNTCEDYQVRFGCPCKYVTTYW